MTKYIKPPRSDECEWRSGPPPEIAEWAIGVFRAEEEQLRADAERYRWLRDPANAYADEWNLFGPYSSPKEIDAAIDAAMKEESGEQSTSSFENFMEIPYGAR